MIQPSVYGPCHGERGRMTEMGGKIQCHICGLFFDGLCTHIWRRHDMTPDDYRREFGLPPELGMVSSRTHLRLRMTVGANLRGKTKRRDVGEITEAPCRVCGKPIQQRPQARPRVICSEECRMAEMLATRVFKKGVSQPQTAARVAARERNAAARRAKFDAIRATRIRVCAHCGSEFNVPRESSKKQTCSYRCRNKFFGFIPPWQKKRQAAS